ncbi:hypothetical protein M378DRAFT_86059 [Amanita muscaria Koide BX008]|uniref:Aerobactin siderophore biosynthesis IucA/IucC N-terminal domain-containing protein n=1 Tax=Amanita muscaria (strain Koide BX008) TaxID=946122 RepID=A0A0C2WPT9_AMAMK|nr:hypothetical protein M378DRAFT_86059 [Amanita muscaria Koide BX008]
MYPSAARLAHLSPPQRAAFSVSSRLITCLVAESLLRAVYFPLSDVTAVGFAIVLLDDPTSNAVPTSLLPSGLFAVIPLQHVPILSDASSFSTAKPISLLDPLDMVPLIFIVSEDQMHAQLVLNEFNNECQHVKLAAAISRTLENCGWFKQTAFEPCWDPVHLWNIYAHYANLESPSTNEIANEIASSLRWQTYSFQNPAKAPQFMSPNIEWEQSIIEGHPTHPMHKTRSFLPPLPDYVPENCDLYQSNLRFAVVPKVQLKVTNDFEYFMKPVVDLASRLAGEWPAIAEDRMIVPVHRLQVEHILNKFPDVEILSEKYMVPIVAQQSIRSVLVPNAFVDRSLKLAVGLKLTSTVRTISPEAAYLGPRFSSQVVPYLQLDPNIVTVVRELASVVHAHLDGEIAKHCAAIVREDHESTYNQRGERLIVCTALVESGHAGEGGDLPAVIRIFKLDTEEKRLDWLDKFVRIFLMAFLPSVLYNGVAFECHPQNCLARFDQRTKEIRGFVVRDYGGLRVHPETLRATTGVIFDCLPGHSIVAPSLDDVYKRMYHTVIHNHLQQLIRVLGLHYSGQGWRIVRKHLMDIVPKGHGLYKMWLSPDSSMVESKCFLRMRMVGMSRFHLHSPVPNLIHYCGSCDSQNLQNPAMGMNEGAEARSNQPAA